MAQGFRHTAHGARLSAHGSWRKAFGTRLMAQGKKRPVKSIKKLMNTRLPCIVYWLGVDMDVKIKWLNLPHPGIEALRAGRTSNVQHRIMYSVNLK
jgi:hypothetical protein